METPEGEQAGGVFYDIAFGKNAYYKHQGGFPAGCRPTITLPFTKSRNWTRMLRMCRRETLRLNGMQVCTMFR